MNMKYLEYFLKVVEMNSFTKAAEELYVSQSAISQSIKSFEEELGFPLMERNKKGFELTPAGKYIYLEGKNLLHNIQDVTNHANYISKNRNETLRIGYVINYGYQELKKGLMLFHEKYPEVKIELRGGTHDVASSNSINDLTDILIGDQRKAFSPNINNIYLGDLYYTVRVSNASSLSHKNEFRIEDLKGYPWIIVAPTREEIQNEIDFIRSNFNYDGDFLYTNSLIEANLMVAANIGFLVSASKIKEKTDDGSITSVPLFCDDQIIVCKLYGYYKKSFDETIYEKLTSVMMDVLK
ncbi:MAG: LysR family transcriptional regulator [Bacilli bacterium]|nr:LysR family transcriptional regulator [Bacilli bacterium]